MDWGKILDSIRKYWVETDTSIQRIAIGVFLVIIGIFVSWDTLGNIGMYIQMVLVIGGAVLAYMSYMKLAKEKVKDDTKTFCPECCKEM